ncbi:NAD(P)-binding protein [Aspergillus ellipticus CBS 707.79]|uniref:NAD(P)-binding protein n=1 Tax=Aspergillus ellipticus CBS 707.79 TaxID=1448320 RepID=A0A319CUH1_9EURO|nr:NAD(P)-binding protein [Aspergillus ellipticus CBS 707.79]
MSNGTTTTTTTTTTVLITGVARGIGLSLLKHYLLRPNHTILATIRTLPTPPEIHPHYTLPKAKTTTLHILPLENTLPESFPTLLTILTSTLAIKSIDIVIANSGICPEPGTPATVSLDAVAESFEVNTLGTMRLFQTARGLLEKSTVEGGPKWVTVSTGAASLGLFGVHRAGWLAGYGVGKVGLGWFTL